MPNPQAAVDSATTFYLNQGVLGGTIVLLLLLLAAAAWIGRRAFTGWQACQEARVIDAKLATEALTRAAATTAEAAIALRDLREGQTEIMRIVSLTPRDGENGDKRTQEKIDGLTKATDDVGRRLEQICRGGAPDDAEAQDAPKPVHAFAVRGRNRRAASRLGTPRPVQHPVRR